MGTRGPIGKDPERRAGHYSRAQREAHDNVAAIGVVPVPRASSRWSPSAKRWYAALRQSAIADRYEPSDWALAYRAADLMTRADKADAVNAALERVIASYMSSLGTSIGDRRRMQLEVRRTGGARTGNVTQIAAAPGYSSADLFG